MDAWFRGQDIDPATLVAVLNPYHLADLQLEDMKLYKNMLESNRLFGFTVFTFSQLPYYKQADGTKVAFGNESDRGRHPMLAVLLRPGGNACRWRYRSIREIQRPRRTR